MPSIFLSSRWIPSLGTTKPRKTTSSVKRIGTSYLKSTFSEALALRGHISLLLFLPCSQGCPRLSPFARHQRLALVGDGHAPRVTRYRLQYHQIDHNESAKPRKGFILWFISLMNVLGALDKANGITSIQSLLFGFDFFVCAKHEVRLPSFFYSSSARESFALRLPKSWRRLSSTLFFGTHPLFFLFLFTGFDDNRSVNQSLRRQLTHATHPTSHQA